MRRRNSDAGWRSRYREGSATVADLLRRGGLLGTRVVLTAVADRYPHGLVHPGARGVVVEADVGDPWSSTFIGVKLDNAPGWLYEEGWEGVLHYYDVDEFLSGVELERNMNPPPPLCPPSGRGVRL